jgi:hypothetical protein
MYFKSPVLLASSSHANDNIRMPSSLASKSHCMTACDEKEAQINRFSLARFTTQKPLSLFRWSKFGGKGVFQIPGELPRRVFHSNVD